MTKPKRAPLEVAERRALELGRMLKIRMPESWGFTLVMFSYDSGPDGLMTYLSSAERDGCIAMLKELIHRLETDTGEI